MFLKKSAQGLILSAILCLATVSGARANDFGDLLQGFVGHNYNGDYSNLTATNQMATINNIQNRITQLRSDANVAVQSRQISHNQYINMMAELDRIANTEANYAADGLTFGEAQALVGMLDTVAARLTNYGADEIARLPNYSPRADSYGFASINERQAFIQRRIDLGVRNGRLTQLEASGLRGQLDRIARDEASMRLGGLSGWERQNLLSRLDRLNDRVTTDLSDGQIAGRHQRWF